MIFVTGASGLIGSFVCRKLIEKGYAVKALKRSNSDLSLVQDIQDQIQWVEGDLMNILEIGDYLEDVEKIIHCAAFVSYDSRDEDLMHQINVDGTANLVNWAVKKNIHLFVHFSSVASIGKDKNKDVPVSTEETQWTSGEKTSAYARSKHQAELEVWRGYAEGLNTIIINPSLVLGPGDWHRSSTQIFKYVEQQNRFYTAGTANFVDVRDVAEVTYRLLETDHYGERFIVNAGNVSYKKLFDTIADKMGKNPPQIQVSGPVIKLAILLEKIRSKISGSAPLVTDELAQVSENKHTYDNQKVKHATNIEFHSLEETVDWTCQQLAGNANAR